MVDPNSPENERRRAEAQERLNAKEAKEKQGTPIKSHIAPRSRTVTVDESLMPARHFNKPNVDHVAPTPEAKREIPQRPNFKLSVGGEEYDVKELREQARVAEPAQPERVHKPFVAPKGTGDPAPKGYFRIELPSRFRPYSFKEIFVRPLEVEDLFTIASAHKNNDFTLFLDAIAHAVSEDIRDLTSPDYRFILYWLRLNSYTRSPYVLNWTSRYGNVNKLTIEKTDLKFVELEMTQEEYDSFVAQGVVFPTVRDAELISQVEEDSIDKFIMERAQYVYTPDRSTTAMQSKIDALKAGGIPMMEAIRDFASNIDHGVVETAIVVDEQYDPKQAIEYFREASAAMTVLADNAIALLESEGAVSAGSQANVARLIATANDMLAEADEIEKILKEGGKPQPREETVPLEINALSFFPEI